MGFFDRFKTKYEHTSFSETGKPIRTEGGFAKKKYFEAETKVETQQHKDFIGSLRREQKRLGRKQEIIGHKVKIKKMKKNIRDSQLAPYRKAGRSLSKLVTKKTIRSSAPKKSSGKTRIVVINTKGQVVGTISSKKKRTRPKTRSIKQRINNVGVDTSSVNTDYFIGSKKKKSKRDDMGGFI